MIFHAADIAMLRGDRVLITGSTGLLGASVVWELVRRGCSVVALWHRHKLNVAGVELVRVDLSQPGVSVETEFSAPVNWVVHCAAATDVDWCERNPDAAFRINVVGTENAGRIAQRMGARFVHISTDSVFDGERGHYREEDSPCPLNTYARTKLQAERLVQREMSDSLLVRTNIFGWNLQPKFSLAEWALDRLERGQEVPGFYDVVFSPLLVNDFCEYLFSMMEEGCRGIWHVAGAEAVSKFEFARRLAAGFGHRTELVKPVSLSQANLLARRPLNTSLDVSRLSRLLGSTPARLDDGVAGLRTLRDTGFVLQLKQRYGGALH